MLFSEHHRITLDKGSWLLGNINQTGYFRVNYDLRNWRLLIDQLIRNHEVNWTYSLKICLDIWTSAILILNNSIFVFLFLFLVDLIGSLCQQPSRFDRRCLQPSQVCFSVDLHNKTSTLKTASVTLNSIYALNQKSFKNNFYLTSFVFRYNQWPKLLINSSCRVFLSQEKLDQFSPQVQFNTQD